MLENPNFERQTDNDYRGCKIDVKGPDHLYMDNPYHQYSTFSHKQDLNNFFFKSSIQQTKSSDPFYRIDIKFMTFFACNRNASKNMYKCERSSALSLSYCLNTGIQYIGAKKNIK